jgi:DNA polymerase-3 subunit delta
MINKGKSNITWEIVYREIAQGKHRPVYICFGDEVYFLQQLMSRLEQQFVAEDQKDFAVARYDLQETSIDVVIEDALTPPFLVEKKIIFATHAKFLSGETFRSKVEHRAEALAEYAYNPVESTILVVALEGSNLDERKKVVKQLKDHAACLQMNRLRVEELPAWLTDYARARGVVVERDAAQLLVERVGDNMQNLIVEMDKISMFAGKGVAIDAAMVEELSVKKLEDVVFTLADCVAERRVDRALTTYYDLLSQKEQPVVILILIARHLRLMLQTQELSRQGLSPAQIAGQLKLAPFVVNKYIAQARRWKSAQLRVMLDELAELDFAIKTSRVADVKGLELFILRSASTTG